MAIAYRDEFIKQKRSVHENKSPERKERSRANQNQYCRVKGRNIKYFDQHYISSFSNLNSHSNLTKGRQSEIYSLSSQSSL